MQGEPSFLVHSFNELTVVCKGIINATGPFSDALLTLDNPSHKPIVQASSGIHITLPNYYSPRNMGLLDPSTSDGRVIFFLPWQGNTIAGTTDTAATVEREPLAQEEEIRWVLEEVRRYLAPDIKVRRGDVLSAWSGLRPLVRNPNAASTEGLVRNHMIHVSDSGLLTIAGGKWTTYRAMAQETVDEAVKVFSLKARSGCITEEVKLVGSDGWSRNMFIGLIQRVTTPIYTLVVYGGLTTPFSMASRPKSPSTSLRTMVTVHGPSVPLPSPQEFPGHCTGSASVPLILVRAHAHSKATLSLTRLH